MRNEVCKTFYRQEHEKNYWQVGEVETGDKVIDQVTVDVGRINIPVVRQIGRNKKEGSLNQKEFKFPHRFT